MNGYELSGKVKRSYTIYDLLFWCSVSFITGLVVHAIHIGATP